MYSIMSGNDGHCLLMVIQGPVMAGARSIM